MDKPFRRLLSMALALVMVLGMVPFNALAAEVPAGTADGWNADYTVYTSHGAPASLQTLAAELGDYKSPTTNMTLSAFGRTLNVEVQWSLVSGSATYSITPTVASGASTTYAVTANISYSLSIFSGTATVDLGSFTVNVYDILTVTTNKDGEATPVTTKIYRDGEKVTVDVPEYDGYNVTVTGATKNDAGEWVVAETGLSGDASVTILYEKVEAVKHNVKLNVVGGEYGEASLSLSGELAEGTSVTVTATPLANTNNASYNYTVSGVTLDANNAFVVGTEDVTVTVTFTANILSGKETAEVPYYAAMSQGDLAQSIFTALAVNSVPAGVTVDDVTIYYYPYHDAGIGTDGFNAGMVLLGEAAPADDTSLNPHTYYDFGERGLEQTEKVRIVYGDLYIEAEITLVEGREKATLSYTKPAELEFETSAEIEAAVLAAVNTNSSNTPTLELVSGELPTSGNPATLTYKVSVAEDANYLANEITVEIDVKAKVNPATINITVNGEGTVAVGNLTASGTLTAGTYTLTADPDDVVDNVGYYVSSITVNGTEIADDLSKYADCVFTGSITVENEKTYNIVITFAQRSLNPELTTNVTLGIYPGVAYADLSAERQAIISKNLFDAMLRNTTPSGLQYNDADVTIEFESVGSLSGNTAWRALDFVAPTGLGNIGAEGYGYSEFPTTVDSTVDVKITWTGDERYPTVSLIRTVTLTDGRGTTAITVDTTKLAASYEIGSVEDLETVIAAVEAATTFNPSAAEGQTHNFTIKEGYTLPASGETTTVTVVISATGGLYYKDATEEVEVTIVGKAQPSSVTVKTEGNGTATVTNAAGTEVTSSLADTLTITATPETGWYVESVVVTDKDGNVVTVTDGAYSNTVFTGKFALANDNAYTVTVIFAERVLNVNATGTVEINGYYEATANEATFNSLRTDVLTVAGLEPTGDYTVEFVHAGSDYLPIYIEDISSAERAAMFGAIGTLPETRDFRITLNGSADGQLPAVTKTISITLTDSRVAPTVAHNGDTYTVDALDDALLAAIEADLTVNGKAVDVELAFVDVRELPAEGQTGNVRVIVKVAETDAYLASDVTITVEVTNQAWLSAITVVPVEGYTIEITDADGQSVIGKSVVSGDYTITITPNTTLGYFVVGHDVNGTMVYTGTYDENYVYTATLTVANGETEATATSYEVTVPSARHLIVKNETIADVYYSGNYNEDLLKAVYYAIVDEEATNELVMIPIDFSLVTIECNETVTAAGTYTFTITWNPSEADAARIAPYSVTAEVDLVESRPDSDIFVKDFEVIYAGEDTEDAILAALNANVTTNGGELAFEILDEIPVITTQGEKQYVTVKVTAAESTQYAETVKEIEVAIVGETLDASVTVQIIGTGTVEGIADGTYAAGEYTVTMTPGTDFFVDYLTVNGETVTANEDGTFTVTIVNGTGLALGEVPEYAIVAAFIDPSITILEESEVTYYPGMTTENLVDEIIEDVAPEAVPEDLLATDDETIVEYLARPAGDYTFSITVPYLGVQEITVQLGEIWLEIDEPFPEFVMPNLTMDDVQKIVEQVGYDFENITLEQLKSISGLENIEYAGAHEFGALDSETIRITSNSQRFGTVISNTAAITMLDNRIETQLVLNEGVVMTYGFTEAELMAALVDGVYANGVKVDGLTVEFVTNVVGMPASEEAQTVQVRFRGNSDYQDCAAETTIIVNKAPCEVAVGNTVVRYGTDYELPISTSPAGINTITFIAGIDVADVDVSMDGEVVGLMGEIILILPDEVLNILAPYVGTDGASMTVSELQAAATQVSDALALVGVSNDVIDTLIDTLQKLPTETADLEIVIGGKPTDSGAYLVGSISADSNYETDIGAGYLVITPDGKKVELEWNMVDENGIITLPVIQSGAFDLGAHVTHAYEGSVEEAQKQVLTLFIGVDSEGNISLTADQKTLTYGAYTELAMISEFGNTMYYAEPLFRAFVVTPTPIEIHFVDENGNVNNDRQFEFNNEPHELAVAVNGSTEGYTGELTVHYYGVQADTALFDSETGPVHAGVYTAIATYVEKDANGQITGFGMDAAVIVVLPTESTINVDNAYVVYGVDAPVNANSLVTAGSTVAGIVPNTTVITAALADNHDFSENGLEAIEGVVDVDFPTWLDNILKEHVETLAPAYTGEGVKVTDVIALIEAYRPTFEELGVSTETIDSIINVLAQIPDNLMMTCLDDVQLSNVGAYLVVGIVTDSDHLPSVDAGVVLIVPNTVKAELEYIQDWNNNHIFTLDTVQNNVVDLGAQAYLNGELNADVTALVKNLYITVDPETFEIKLYDDQANLTPGVYTEISYLLHVDADPLYYAEPISRVFIVSPNVMTVEFHDETGAKNHDRKFTFDNQPHGMGDVVVLDAQGNVIDTTNGTLSVVYMGASAGVEPYFRETAPTHAGAYTVVATYVELDENNNLVAAGSAVGALVIEPAEASVNVDSQIVIAGSDYDLGITVETDVADDEPKTITIVAGVDVSKLDAEGMGAINSNINVDFPEKVDEVLAVVFPALYSADGISSADFLARYDEAVAALAELGIETEALDLLKSLLEQMPNRSITANETQKPTEIGAYLVFSMVFDPDYTSAMDMGLLVITPDVVPGKLHFNQEIPGLLNILPSEAVADFDFGVSGVEYANDGSASAMDPAKINNVILGVTHGGQLFFGNGENTPTEMGVYDQFGYVPDNVDEDWYMIVPVLRTFTIVKSSADVVFYDENGNTNYIRKHTYDGTQPVIIPAAVYADGTEAEGVTLTVNVVGVMANGETYNSSEIPTQVGVYDIVAYCIDSEQNVYTMGTAALYIEEAELTVTADDLTKVYGEADPALTYTADGLVAGDELVVTLEREAGEDVGEYTITVTVQDHPNYNITVVNGTLTITKAETTFTAPTANELTYTGEAQELVTAGTANGGTMLYSLDGENWSETIPTGTEAGEYTVYYYVKGDANHADSEIGTITVTIEKSDEVYEGKIIDTGRTLSLDGVIYINQYVKVEGFENLTQEYIAENGGMLIWDHEITEEDAVYDSTYDMPGLIISGSEYMQRTAGIAAKEYADVVYLRVYIELPNGEYVYGPLKEYSVRHYCETIINRGTNAKLMDTCIAMLHFGTSAQIYFNYNEDDYANKNIVDTYPSVEWDPTLIDAVTPFTTSITASDSVSDNGRTLSLDGAIVINAYYGFTGIAEEAELLVWDGVSDELTADNVSYSVDLTLVNGEYWAQSGEFASKEYGKTIYLCAHFVDENGMHHYSDVVAFSPEEYARRIIAKSSNPELVDLVQKMVIYGEFARIYFDK